MTGRGNGRWPEGFSEMASLIRGHTWEALPLGPTDRWSPALRAAVDLILGSPMAMSVFWGQEHALLYNGASRKLVPAHPHGLGRHVREGWPELWKTHRAACEAALAGEARSVPNRTLGVRLDGASEPRRFDLTFSPLRDDRGAVAGVLLTAVEVDGERRRLQAELQHRVRNMLAIIRSIAGRTAETSESVEDYAMHLDGRIAALARVEAAVARDPAEGVDLAALVADELLAASAQEGRKLTLEGPNVPLPTGAAETFGLAIHGLATNAI